MAITIKYRKGNAWKTLGLDNIKDENGNTLLQKLSLKFYPVGSIYLHYSGSHINDNNNTPANIIGGSWSQLNANKALTTIQQGDSGSYNATNHTHLYSIGYSSYYGALVGNDVMGISLYDWAANDWTTWKTHILQANPINTSLQANARDVDITRVTHVASVSPVALTTKELPRVELYAWQRIS